LFAWCDWLSLDGAGIPAHLCPGAARCLARGMQVSWVLVAHASPRRCIVHASALARCQYPGAARAPLGASILAPACSPQLLRTPHSEACSIGVMPVSWLHLLFSPQRCDASILAPPQLKVRRWVLFRWWPCSCYLERSLNPDASRARSGYPPWDAILWPYAEHGMCGHCSVGKMRGVGRRLLKPLGRVGAWACVYCPLTIGW
jgi:hypothetical protein